MIKILIPYKNIVMKSFVISYFKIFCSLPIFVLLLVSCNKDISLSPLTFQTTGVTTAAQLNNQLAAIYSPLEAEQLYGWGLWGYFASGGDEFFSTNDATGSATQQLTQSFRSSSQDASYLNLWRNLYMGIERANVLLNVIDQPAMDSATRANIKGQALFLRAYYFYLLVNNFGDVPYKTQLTSSMGNSFSLPETPSKSIYDSIIKDMITADSLVQTITQVQTTTQVTKSAVEGVLARVCLSAAGYPINGGQPYYNLALIWAEKVINSGVHALNSTSHPFYPTTPAYARLFINNMQDNFNDKNLSEGMWDAAFLSNGVGGYVSQGYVASQQLGVIMGVTCPSPTAKSTGIYRALPTLYNLFGAGDQRRDWAISPYILDSSGTNKLYNLGVTVKIASGFTKTPIDTVYKNGIIYRIDYDTTFYGSGASASANMDPITGAILSFVITNGGSGYSSTALPSITVTFPSSGKNFKFATPSVTIIGGALASINIANSGSGYVTAYDRPVGKWRREYEANILKNPTYTSSNFPIIRYADVLLMAAEADLQVRGGGSLATSVGIGYYNQVKRRAYGYSPTSSSPVDVSVVTIDSIRAERSRELCFEGVRKSDLKRWGLSVWTNTLNNVLTQMNLYNVANTPTSANLTASQATINNFLSYPQKYSFYPIPANELALESALSQNTGW